MKPDKLPVTQSKSYDWNRLLKHIAIVIGIGFIANMLIIYFTTENFKINQFKLFDIRYVAIAFVLGLTPIFIHAYSIYAWVRCFNKKISFKAATKISATTLIGSAITPTMIGGGPLKMGMLMRYKLTTGQAAAITTLGGIQDFITMVLFIIVSVIFSERISPQILFNFMDKLYSNSQSLILFLVVISTASFLTYWILSNTKSGKKVMEKLKDSMHDFKASYALVAKEGKGYFIGITLLNIVKWILIHLILVFLLMGLNLNTDYWEVFFSEWLVFTGMTATPLPGGSGGAETIFYFVYKPIIPATYIGVTILAWRFFTDYAKLILSALLVVWLNASKSK